MKVSKVQGVLRLRCPRCREGKVFKGWFKMYDVCEACGLKYEREPGYFLGSMYISYGMGGVLMIAWVVGLDLSTNLPFSWILGSAVVLLWLLTPLIFRYSRMIFMVVDRNAFPD